MHLESEHAEMLQAIADKPYIARRSTPENRELIRRLCHGGRNLYRHDAVRTHR
jgi:hypothetical protein